MANTNEQIAKGVLEAIGGKENIETATHCMTRLRFVLKDGNIPKEEEVKKIDGVLGVAVSGGQFQVIIGPGVTKVYQEVKSQLGLQEDGEAAADVPKVKEKLTLKKAGANIMNYMSGSFVPLIPVFISAALFRTICMILGPDMLKIVSAESDLYLMCDFIYDAGFYFMPIYLGYTAAKKIGATPVLGMMLGASLIAPDFVAMMETRETILMFNVLPAPVMRYGQTVLPILIAVFFLYYIEKFFNKVVPEMLATVFAPFLTMVVTIPVTFCLAAPLGSWLGTLIGNALFWLSTHGGFLALAVIAAVYQLLVMVGMHHVIGNLAIAVMLEQGVEYCVRPAGSIAMFAVFGMALGAFLRIKDKKEKSLALGYFATGLIGGVTEPTIFGVGIRYKRPFVGMAIGGFIGGLYAGITHVGCYSFASPGILGVMAFINGGTANMVNGCIACAIATVGAAAATYILGGFEKKEAK